jgi:hypothetical protein
VARIRQVQRAPLQRDGARQHVELDVQLAQVEVGGGQVGAQHQAHVLQVGRRLLRDWRARRRPCAHAAPQVGLVATLSDTAKSFCTVEKLAPL